MTELQDLWTQLQQRGDPPPLLLIDCAGVAGGARALPHHAFSRLECLFAGDLADELVDVAPYLAQVASFEARALQAVQHLVREKIAILLDIGVEAASLEARFDLLHRHFRKYNVVYRHDGQPLFFRYYDPRVLPAVLEVLEPAQKRSLLAHVRTFVTAGPGGEMVLHRSAGQG